MTLGEKQELFTRCLSKLFVEMHTTGYEVRMGEGYVALTDAADGDYDGPHKQSGGHYNKLAIDLDLFKNGRYLHETENHEPFGIFWEGLHSLCCWGGRFSDGNHYSIEHEGVK